MNNSVEDMTDANSISGPFVTTVVTSPNNNGQHFDHILPKTVTGAHSAKGAHPIANNHRTTVGFFRSVHNNSGNVFHHTSGSRDSGRGLGGGWNGGIIEEGAAVSTTSPQRPERSIAEIPGLTYLQVKVSFDYLILVNHINVID